MIAVTEPQRANPIGRTQLIVWGFALFNGLRVVGYLPTLHAIAESGQTEQHSILTWLTFCGANATMSLWLLEQRGGRWNRAIVVNTLNAAMCAAICATIAWLRWS